ncbi:hypothetical protein [Patulibacter minatonensis]|uniref:hypothetical protein n=1 Tax=Patulibacter minatonensis TaxID=298163 RepID=UPI00047A8482|nr:hypothetical protein [Patulibacter minatonensis]
MNDGPPKDPTAGGSTSGPGDVDPDVRDDPFLAQLANLRRSLAQSVIETGERVQETIEDAVRRGRMTRRDAHELAAAIVAASKRQSDEIRQELEALLERGRRLGRRVDEDIAVTEPVVIPIERGTDAPRTLPIERYDELTAVLVRKSLKDLSPDQLREVREHEASHAKRKTVLDAVDRLLK